MPPRAYSPRPYSAAPLTDEQVSEVLRKVDESFTRERHNYRVMLNGEWLAAIRLAKDDPTNAEQHRAVAVALCRALELLDTCWPVPDLAHLDA